MLQNTQAMPGAKIVPQKDERTRVLDNGKGVANGATQERDGSIDETQARDKVVGGVGEEGAGGGRLGDGETGGSSRNQGHDGERCTSIDAGGGSKPTERNGNGDEAGRGRGYRGWGDRRKYLYLERLDGQTRGG